MTNVFKLPFKIGLLIFTQTNHQLHQLLVIKYIAKTSQYQLR